MSKIRIQTEKKLMPTEPNLYGIFFEDISRAGDGGIYPELLRNRTFEDSIPPKGCVLEEDGRVVVTPSGWRDQFNHGEGLDRWIRVNNIEYTPIPAWYANGAEISLDTEDTLNDRRGAALAMHFAPGGRVWNIGYTGVPQETGKAYNFYMFAKSDKPVHLKVAVEADGKTVSEVTFLVRGNGYIRYDAVLVSGVTTSDARLVLSTEEGGDVKLGFISLMPADTFNGHGLRRDIVEKLRDMHPTFLRFPGGCIVEGITPDTAMRFHNVIGPVWERPGHLLMWHYRTYNGIGFHEYLQLCEDLGMEPLYVFNCGMTCQARCEVYFEGDELQEMIQDTLDAIEYAVGPADSPMGRLRAEAGHPEPFRMNYVEIGNENHGPGYEERYMLCYNAIRERYPWMKFVANTHVEKHGLPADIVDEHYYATAEYFAENIHMYDSYDRNGPGVFLGEFAVLRGAVGQLYAALGEGMFMVGMERNQDVVKLASYAPLLENVNYYSWYPNLLIFNNLQSYVIPTYYAWKLFGAARGSNVVYSEEESPVLYRPMKGMPSLIGTYGMRFKNARWNGEPVEPVHNIIGYVKQDGDSYITVEPDEMQKAECAVIHSPIDRSLIVLGDNEEVKMGTFEIEVFAEEGRDISLGLYTSRMPDEVYKNDETHPPREWNAKIVRPFRWNIQDGVSTLTEFHFPKPTDLVEPKQVSLKMGEFNSFRYVTTETHMELYINGELIQRAEKPHFNAFASVVCDDENEVIIKTVNMAGEVDHVEISLDCDVESDYEVLLLTGEPNAENSFEKPENVHDVTCALTGAARNFVYEAPAYSINILRLKKKA